MSQEHIERLGFNLVSAENAEYQIGIRQKWYWDCIMTKLTQLVVVRTVETLTIDIMEQDRIFLEEKATSLDPSRLPKGMQKGSAIIMCYKAKKVTPAAKSRCIEKPNVRFAFFYVPAVLETSTGECHYVKSTPVWGSIYYAKFRFIIRQVLGQEAPRDTEPLSKIGLSITLFLFFVISLQIILLSLMML